MEEMDTALFWPSVFFQNNIPDGRVSVYNHEPIMAELHTPQCDRLVNATAPTVTVSEVILNALVQGGIRHVFGPATFDQESLPFDLQALENNDLNYYGIHHEGAAAFACSSYGKLTKRPAACLATTKQGAAKFIAGLRDASVDRVPVLTLIETDDHSSTAEHFDEFATWSRQLDNQADPAERVMMACKTALINRGVSQLGVPQRMLRSRRDPNDTLIKSEPLLPSLKIEPPKDALRDAVRLLRASERPVIIVGQGAGDSMEDVIMLAEQIRAPIMTTFKGKGLISDRHALAAGVMGAHGTPVSAQLLEEADAILVFGANFFSDRGTIPNKPIVKVDHDLQALARCEGVDVPVWGEIGVTAQALSDVFLGDMWTLDQIPNVAKYWARWRELKQQEINQYSLEKTPAEFFSGLGNLIDDDAIIVIDAGEEMNAFGRYFECIGHTVIMPAHKDTVGFAVPAAIGAWVATQEDSSAMKGRQVVAVCDRCWNGLNNSEQGDIGADMDIVVFK